MFSKHLIKTFQKRLEMMGIKPVAIKRLLCGCSTTRLTLPIKGFGGRFEIFA